MRSKSKGPSRGRIVALMTCLMLLALPVSPAAAEGPPTVVTFSYTGAAQNWTVPPERVSQVTIEAWGAQGGGGSGGGEGGRAKRTIPVVAGEVLEVNVGGVGGQPAGGWNGGAAGASSYGGRDGYGGGGASDVRQSGATLANRVVAAAGGGGRQWASSQGGLGGDGGGTTGATGTDDSSADAAFARGGGGGTQASGGLGGFGTYSGSAGSFGVGGAGGGGGGAGGNAGAGGGGGGGYNGGGGAGASSTYGAGGGGGGGSSYAPGGETEAGVRSGNGLVTITYTIDEKLLSPSTPAQVFPPAGHAFGTGDEQRFVIESVDVEGEYFTGTIELRTTGGSLAQTLTTASTPPGAAVATTASPALAAGSYQWRAKACQTTTPTNCSAFSGYQAFSVGDNAAPAAPQIVYPLANAVFQPGQRQDFTIKTTDPDNDPYTGEIKFREMDGDYAPQKVDTHPAPSGAASSGTLGTNGLAPGTYTMEATAEDNHGATSDMSDQQIGVAGLAGSPCTAAGTLVDGWFGDRYLQVATATVGDVGFVCVSTAQAGQEVGKFSGWLRAEANGGTYGGGAPTVGTTASCDEDADGLLPFPLLDQTVGPPAAQVSVWGGLLNTGASVTACLKLKAGTSTLLDHAVTIAAPDGAQLSDLDFVPAAPTWTPPLEVAPPAGLASSECYQAAAGKQRFVNAKVDGQHIWLYSQSAANTTRLCARIQGTTSNGVVLRQQSGPTGQPVTWQVGLPVDHASSPCDPDWQWYMSNEPYHARLRTSAPGDDPLGVCLSAGEDGTALAAWLAMDLSPGTPVTTYQVDS